MNNIIKQSCALKIENSNDYQKVRSLFNTQLLYESFTFIFITGTNINYRRTHHNNGKLQGFIHHYHSFSRPNVCLERFQMDFAGPQIYLQPAEIESHHSEVSLKFFVCN